MLERGGPVWSGVYPPGSSLQHAAQLQLLSQQQMLRQQELLMIQQHTAQVLELQRNAQFVVSGFTGCTRAMNRCDRASREQREVSTQELDDVIKQREVILHTHSNLSLHLSLGPA